MKDFLQSYSIVFRGLSAGEHIFWFTMTDKFFSFFPESEIKKARIRVKSILKVSGGSLQITTLMKGKTWMPCDLCLEEMELPIKYKTLLNVKFAEVASDISDVDDTITLSDSDNEISMAQHFYEYAHLRLPIKRVHKKNSEGKLRCDANMIQLLKSYSGETSAQKDSQSVDPRWEQLKNIKLN